MIRFKMVAIIVFMKYIIILITLKGLKHVKGLMYKF